MTGVIAWGLALVCLPIVCGMLGLAVWAVSKAVAAEARDKQWQDDSGEVLGNPWRVE